MCRAETTEYAARIYALIKVARDVFCNHGHAWTWQPQWAGNIFFHFFSKLEKWHLSPVSSIWVSLIYVCFYFVVQSSTWNERRVVIASKVKGALVLPLWTSPAVIYKALDFFWGIQDMLCPVWCHQVFPKFDPGVQRAESACAYFQDTAKLLSLLN